MTPEYMPPYNSTKTGLDGETEDYLEIRTALWKQLSPEGVLEETFAAEILTAAWRLRRCRILEQNLAADEQKSVDHARAQSHNILKRSLAELRRLQTERAIRSQSQALDVPGVADTKQVAAATLAARKANNLDTLEALIAKSDKQLGMGTSFCNSATPDSVHPKQTARNAICPCGSGTKYKRCCGTNAPPVLTIAA